MGRKISDFKDGIYRVSLRSVDEENNIVHAMLFTKRGRKYKVDISLEYLKKFYLNEITPNLTFTMTKIDDGDRFKFERVYFSRINKLRASRSKLVAKVLAEKYGSVDGFLQYHEITIYPNTPQKEIYKLLKQAQHEIRS